MNILESMYAALEESPATKVTATMVLPKIISESLERMQMAGELIELAKRREPSKATDIDSVFVSLRPSELLKNKADWVFKAHARELIRRAVNRRDLNPATRAEVMCFLYELSLKAPLRGQPASLYVDIFRSVAPKKLTDKIEDMPEPWEGANEELEIELRKKLAQERRPRVATR